MVKFVLEVCATMLLVCCVGQPHREGVSDVMPGRVSVDAPVTTERDAPQECRVGRLDEHSESVELRELAESPQKFEGRSVKVTGYVLDLYELASITDGSGRYAVSASWGKLDIRACRRRKVIAEGILRSVPHSRFKHALQVKALLDAQSVDSEER
jgi:hypothetical protein